MTGPFVHGTASAPSVDGTNQGTLPRINFTITRRWATSWVETLIRGNDLQSSRRRCRQQEYQHRL